MASDSVILPGILYVWLQQRRQKERERPAPRPTIPAPVPPAVPDRDVAANLKPIRISPARRNHT